VEGNEAVVGDQERGERVAAGVEERAELVDENVAAQVVVGGEEEVPADWAEPGQAARVVDGVADGGYFVEAFELDEEDEERDCEWSCANKGARGIRGGSRCEMECFLSC